MSDCNNFSTRKNRNSDGSFPVQPTPSFLLSYSNRLRLFFIVVTLLFFCQLFSIVDRVNGAVSTIPTQRPYVINNRTYFPLPISRGYVEQGVASWYGPNFHGRRTSNGEQYNMHKQTAAHKILPMNTMVLVTNLENNRKTVVRINDRGPFIDGRIIDLSYSAAREIGLIRKGTARVQVTALMQDTPNRDNYRKGNIPDFYRGRFFVQIGSFVSKDNANRLLMQFTDSGHKTVIQKYYTPDTLYYRVQVWVGNDLHQARRARRKLIESGYKKAFIIAH